jgi:hypothetical protein
MLRYRGARAAEKWQCLAMADAVAEIPAILRSCALACFKSLLTK